MKSLAVSLCFGMLCLVPGMARALTAQNEDRPPLLRCSKARLVSEGGQPLAHADVGLMWIEVDWDKNPPQGVTLAVKTRKKLKTDSNGEFSIPKMSDGRYGPYLLEVLLFRTGTEDMSAEGHFQSAAKPEGCIQVLEIRGKQILTKAEDQKK
jgi:hypothetical protein